MWLFFFILAIIATCVLLVHVTLELNTLDKETNSLITAITNHYETHGHIRPHQPAGEGSGGVSP